MPNVGAERQSNPVRIVTGQFTTFGPPIWTNPRPTSIFILTFVGAVNLSASSTDGFLLACATPPSAPVGFHSGFVGSGSLDRFPLVCEVPLYYQDTLSFASLIGTWNVVCAGYYEPQVLTS